ncbi:PEGA domain-containing protein [Persicimonas caeni]|uniref:PEGA domain-containing protein n=1 Tax=Persicimonas caeni TaxID=2292766 RepID=A0A4Y6PU21_PERCE|nr:PEGA domain-containing protein [Persicimonas caeni]QDG51517.1 PEGA domain-containing protein [Persicimonas caeni]QED32738.1 PEGA domain-containing protein [Persicimonas caeni]
MTRRLLMLALSVSLVGWALAGCSAVQRIPDRQESTRAYLRLDVEPSTTRVFIDSKYMGIVKGWVQQTVPVEAGARRVELRAEGYITRRFDVELEPGEEVTLQVNMERTLDDEPN